MTHTHGNSSAGFLLRRWEVEVAGYGAGIQCVPTRGQAMADAWRCDAFCHLSFGEFLKIARCRLSKYRPHRFGDPITIDGKPAFYVDHNRQYTQFAWPGGKFVLSAHPYDVLPEEYRAEAYRTPTQTPSPTPQDNSNVNR